MPVSDVDLIDAWKQVLTLSRLEAGDIVTVLTSTNTHPQTLAAAAADLEKAKEMRIHSAAGTDLRCPVGQYPVIKEYGFVDEPGRWDHWPSGFLFTWPNEGMASGRVVLDTGDILLPMKSYVTA